MFGSKKQKIMEKWANEFVPSFGTTDEFYKKYYQNCSMLAVGRLNNKKICIPLSNNDSNKIVVINDDLDSIHDDIVAPILLKGEMSYMVYDADGKHYAAMARTMRMMGYDVQLIDLASEEHISRINLFEIINITKDPHSLSVVLSNAIGGDEAETDAAYNLLMAIMKCNLAKRGAINAVEVDHMFKQIANGDTAALDELEGCQDAREHIMRVYEVDVAVKVAAINKMAEKLFSSLLDKTKHPNVFAITMHSKKTATFIKAVPEQYRYMMTTMLLNLEMSNAMCECDGITTLILDTSEESWYDKRLLTIARSTMDDLKNGCFATIEIMKAIDENRKSEDGLLIYMHSNDLATNVFVRDNMRLMNYTNEVAELSKMHFGGQDLPNIVLERAPIDIDELKAIDGAIIIDMSYEMKPMLTDNVEFSTASEIELEDSEIDAETVDEEIVKNDDAEKQCVEDEVVEEDVEEVAAESEEIIEFENVIEVEEAEESEENKIVDETNGNNEA